MNASMKPLASLSNGAKLTVGSAATALSLAITLARGVPVGRPMPKLLLAYQASVCGSRNGPTTSPARLTRPPVTSVKYSLTLPLGRPPVEKNEVLEPLLGVPGDRLVGEVDQDDDHVDAAAQRRPLERHVAGHGRWRADRQEIAGHDQPVIEADPWQLTQRRHVRHPLGRGLAHLLQRLLDLLLQLRRWCHAATLIAIRLTIGSVEFSGYSATAHDPAHPNAIRLAIAWP